MISATDVPACPACGSREVHPVQKMPERNASEKALGDDPPLEMFYACRGCGRDQTDAWKAVQPKPEMKPITPETAARKFDALNPVPPKRRDDLVEGGLNPGTPRPIEVPDPLTLGVGATVKT